MCAGTVKVEVARFGQECGTVVGRLGQPQRLKAATKRRRVEVVRPLVTGLVHCDRRGVRVTGDACNPASGLSPIVAAIDELDIGGFAPRLGCHAVGGVATRGCGDVSWDAAGQSRTECTAAVDVQLSGLQVAYIGTPNVVRWINESPAGDLATAADDHVCLRCGAKAGRLVDHPMTALPRVRGGIQGEWFTQGVRSGIDVDDDVALHLRR